MPFIVTKPQAIQALEQLQENINRNPHHYTCEKLLADAQRQGYSTIGIVGHYALSLGYSLNGFPSLNYANKPGARELLEVINYVLLEA